MKVRRCAVIGSRSAPDDIVKLMTQFTSILIEIGYVIQSGGCPLGPDRSATIAIQRHKTTDKSKHRIYISWDGMNDMYHDPSNGVYCPKAHYENYPIARIMAEATRGGFYGLYEKGEAHHSRNPYQVLSDDLNTPVDFVLTWAKPKGKTGGVAGGTGTAVGLANAHGITVYNLYNPDVEDRVRNLVRTVVMQRKLKESQSA